MTCSRGNCEKPAVWEPALRIYAVGDCGRPAEGRCIGLGVCDDCRKKLTVDDLMSPEGWQQILGAFRDQGLAPPDRNRLEIVFNRLSSLPPA